MAFSEIVERPSASQPHVAWGAVFAGAAITTAFGLILLAFGAALGLTVSSPYDGEGLSPVAFAIAAGLYLLWVQVMSCYFGGYVTGRLSPRAPGVTDHEADVRDGLHGLVMWGVGVVAATVIAFLGIGGMSVELRNPPDAASASVAHLARQQINARAVNEAAVTPAAQDATLAQRRAEVARKRSILAGFITAASLLVGAAAAFFGSHSGGHHRDKNVEWIFFASRARPRP